MSDWTTEKTEDFMEVRFKNDGTLFSGKSEFQKVEVVQTRWHGKMLLNDDLVMLTEADEFVYHDMITHVPLFTHPNPKNVLVIGGGDGGTAREVLRHSNVEKVVMVEIDKMVVDACLEHIPVTSEVLKGHPKLELIIGDGVKYVNETKEKFDVVIVDSTDPIGPACPLFGPDFYRDVYACLNEDGIVVSQGESPWYNVPIQKSMMKVLSEQFPFVRMYQFGNLTYPGGAWCFTFASKGLSPINDFDRKRVLDSNLKFRYYTPDLHTASFALPQFLLDNIQEYFRG
ncbi:MAG: spermidine synthase [Halobacteriovorax sp.]|nr:spermidine synthase [Halobacteriovorax sp.]|tara:strand:- start:143270 stop:144124 length:855 start_codon:yes stop_codon:yes gene_type:complete